MTKRRKLVLGSFILTCGFLATQLVDISWRYQAIFLFGLAAYLLTALFLKDELRKISWLVILLPVVFYVVFASLFYFLLPKNFLVRILILALFWLGAYAVLLTENIYSIASKFKTIQLLRAAQAVGFIITLVTAFFGYNTLFSFKLAAWFNGVIVFIISWPLILASLWSVVLEEKLTPRLITFSLILSFLAAQTAFIISFWPLSIANFSLFLVSFLYVCLGLMQNFLTGRLFKDTLREFLQVGIIIFIITFFLARWR